MGRKVKVRRGASAWALADLLVWQPAVDAAVVAAELGATLQNALRAVTPLVETGILTEFTGFRRNRMWQSREVPTALHEFAARARATQVARAKRNHPRVFAPPRGRPSREHLSRPNAQRATALAPQGRAS